MNNSSRRDFLRLVSSTAIASTVPSLLFAELISKNYNVLFIAVDDLRPQLGCYGNKEIISPNIDRLASQGFVFERAYCQQAVCMSSRASLMSGYRPEKGQLYKNGPLYKHVPDAYPLNTHFQNNGYHTVSLGKIYHYQSDEKKGWNNKGWHPKGHWHGRGYLTDYAKEIVDEYTRTHPNAGRKGMGPAFEVADVSDNEYPDGKTADEAIKKLNELKDKKFFLGVGFLKPHLPFNAPKKYWNFYDENNIELPNNPYPPKNAPKMALTDWGELRGYHGMPATGPMPDNLTRKLKHGYYACVSYVDAQIGKVLDELDRQNLRKNTIIILWGDHGWKLGEHNMWCKHTNYELDTNAPLIISVPSTKNNGQKTDALIEFVDIYPSLCDLCGLEKPSHLEGRSFVPLLKNPSMSWKEAAFSQYPRPTAVNPRVMGYAVRTKRFRYVEWRNIESQKLLQTELYDHQIDPAENKNVAVNPEYKNVTDKLSQLIKNDFHLD